MAGYDASDTALQRVRDHTRAELEYWALIAEIARAIAIVVSAIYLGVQIRANTTEVTSESKPY
jgi:hypothetical protein